MLARHSDAPDVILEYVDVRDVAAAHVAAMTTPQAGDIVTSSTDGACRSWRYGDPEASFSGLCFQTARRRDAFLGRGAVLDFDKSLRDSRAQMGFASTPARSAVRHWSAAN